MAMVMRRRPYLGKRVPRIALKRTVFLFTWTFGTATTNDFWRYFEAPISDLPDLASYQALFDQYKINAVKYTFRPRYDTVTASATGTNPTSTMHVIKDPESTVTPSGTYTGANVNSFLENGNVRSYTTNKPFSVYYRPKIYQSVSSTGTGSALTGPKYLNLNTDTTVRHRGFHVFWQQQAMATSTQLLDVFVTLYITLRGQR